MSDMRPAFAARVFSRSLIWSLGFFIVKSSGSVLHRPCGGFSSRIAGIGQIVFGLPRRYAAGLNADRGDHRVAVCWDGFGRLRPLPAAKNGHRRIPSCRCSIRRNPIDLARHQAGLERLPRFIDAIARRPGLVDLPRRALNGMPDFVGLADSTVPTGFSALCCLQPSVAQNCAPSGSTTSP